MHNSYHVHSEWSDGSAAIEEYVHAAKVLELDEVGISDHYVLTPEGRQVVWGMPLGRLDDYVDAVQSAAVEGGHEVVVRLGLEADYFPETADRLRELLASYPFDYVIGAVHILDGFSIDDTPANWEPLTQAERDDVVRRYWLRLREMAQSRMFDIAAHLDLTKKFGYRPSVDLRDEISVTLDEIARAGMSVELNTAGWSKPCAEAYPEPRILRACIGREIPIVVTADAHEPANLIRDYDRAFHLLREMGCRQLASYAGRRMVLRVL